MSSAIMDNAKGSWPNQYPTIPWPAMPDPLFPGAAPAYLVYKYEFDALKREVEELKVLLAAANKYDAATGQPHCEHPDKIAFVKTVADFVGVDLKDVL